MKRSKGVMSVKRQHGTVYHYSRQVSEMGPYWYMKKGLEFMWKGK